MHELKRTVQAVTRAVNKEFNLPEKQLPQFVTNTTGAGPDFVELYWPSVGITVTVQKETIVVVPRAT